MLAITASSVAYMSITMIVLFNIDYALKTKYGYKDNHRWCYIHSLANILITVLSFRGMINLLSSDQSIEKSILDGYNLNSAIVVMAIHIYHLIMYKIDQPEILAHHIIMLLVLTIPFFNYNNHGFLMFSDYSLFFMCGLPGAIDYYCMHLYYTNKMDKLTEKRINTYLNNYIRAPGILYGAFYVYRGCMNGDVPISYAVPVVLSFMWNAQFFSSAVSVSYGYQLGKISESTT